MSARSRSAVPGGRRRSAMGEYLPESGERPLSSYGYPTPSAFDYRPSTKAVFPTSPSHSLYSRRHDPTSRETTPGPPAHSTGKNAVWRHHTFTMTRKGTTRPYDTREHAHITCGPGAGHYRREYGNTGSAIRRSMSARHREGIQVGYPNPLVQPVDTLGFATPGPALWRESERGVTRTIGLALKSALRDNEGPGPAAYNLPTPTCPGILIGEKLHVEHDPLYPASNQYTISDSVYNKQAKSFGIKSNIDTDQHFPSPDCYSYPRPKSVSLSFNYRPHPTPGEKCPGPAEYTVTDSDLLTSPDYSCRDKCRPVFPDILLYPEYTPLKTPGAGEYESDHDFANNSAPKYSHGLPLPQKPNSNPGPNHYHVWHEPTLATSPLFSMATRRPDHTPQSTCPSPAEYSLKLRPASAASITPRRARDKVPQGPAANHYHVPGTQTRRGHFPGHMASLKGRRSNVCYSGFPGGHLSRLASLAV